MGGARTPRERVVSVVRAQPGPGRGGGGLPGGLAWCWWGLGRIRIGIGLCRSACPRQSACPWPGTGGRAGPGRGGSGGAGSVPWVRAVTGLKPREGGEDPAPEPPDLGAPALRAGGGRGGLEGHQCGRVSAPGAGGSAPRPSRGGAGVWGRGVSLVPAAGSEQAPVPQFPRSAAKRLLTLSPLAGGQGSRGRGSHGHRPPQALARGGSCRDVQVALVTR